MVMGLHGLFHFHDPEMGMGHSVGHPVAFFDGVLQPEFQRVHAQLFGQFVYHRFNGESALGLPGRPVCLDFLFINHYIIAVN